MAIKLGKYYLTRNNPRDLLLTIADLKDTNYSLKKRNTKAITKINDISVNDLQDLKLMELKLNNIKLILQGEEVKDNV